MDTSRQPNIAFELSLLLVLATLWGGSYTFIKLGVATIPPITLIAARTAIAGILLLIVMKLRGIGDAAGYRNLEALYLPGLPQQRHPLDAGRLGRALCRCRLDHDPQFVVADFYRFCSPP